MKKYQNNYPTQLYIIRSTNKKMLIFIIFFKKGKQVEIYYLKVLLYWTFSSLF